MKRVLTLDNFNDMTTRNHCCDAMNYYTNDKKYSIIIYKSYIREYSIKKNNNLSDVIDHCPWCGKKLLVNLRDEWFDTLEQMGYEDPWNDDIPEEFKTDEWWKTRGL